MLEEQHTLEIDPSKITQEEFDAIIHDMVIADVLALLEYLDKHAEELNVKKALFNPDGTRAEGDKDIVVNVVPVKGKEATQWYYQVQPIDDYTFVYLPVIPSVHVDFGKLKDEQIPSADLFRFVGTPLAYYTSGGAPNVAVKFTVVGYKPSTLLRKAH